MSQALPPPSAFRDIHFPGQHAGERIVLVLRRHPFVFSVTTAYFATLAIVPLILRVLLPESLFTLLRGTAWGGLVVLLVSGYYLFLWLFFSFSWIDYYLDLWIVTDERVVNIEQVGLFNRVVSEHPLMRVQDVTSEVRGLFPTFLNYGDVYVQTAGERERFVFQQVPAPDLVKKVVIQAQKEAFARFARAAGGHAPLQL